MITGAASGFGKALAEGCASYGCKLILLDKDAASLAEVSRTLRERGTSVTELRCDLSVGPDIQNIPADSLKAADVLVNNAGIGAQGSFVERPFEEFDLIARVNYLALAHLTKRYLEQRSLEIPSAIVNVSAIVGLIELPYMCAYSSSKFAVAAFSRCLRAELSGTKIHVMSVYPGPGHTNFGKAFGTQRSYDKPHHRFLILQPEQVANSIIRGLLGGKREIYIPSYLRLFVLFRNMFPSLYEYLICAVQRDRRLPPKSP